MPPEGASPFLGHNDRWARLRASLSERAADIDTPADRFPGDKLIWLSNLSGVIARDAPALLAERDALAGEVEELRAALQWALTWIYQVSDEPESGEAREDYAGHTRLAWPDEPENWASEDSGVRGQKGELNDA